MTTDRPNAEPERIVWELSFSRTTNGEPNDYAAHVLGPPPADDAASWRCIPDGVRAAAQYDGFVNDASSVRYAIAHLADVTDYTDAVPRATAGATTWIHYETINRPRPTAPPECLTCGRPLTADDPAVTTLGPRCAAHY